jgi:hypothetical protein
LPHEKEKDMSENKRYEAEEILSMSRLQLRELMHKGHPIPSGSLDNTCYQGIDLSLPAFMTKLLWKTFRKTFYRDPETGILRGWNVRMEQTGIDGEQIPMTNRKGEPLSFGHYVLRSAEGRSFPQNWTGADFLDYGVAGNTFFDVARLGYCPLIAINEGDSSLLLGWEVFKLGPIFIPLRDYWLLRRTSPLENGIPTPKPATAKDSR